MTSDTLRKVMIVAAAVAAVSVGACKPKDTTNDASNAAASDSNAAAASANTAVAASNAAATDANSAASNASATAPASTNSMSK